MNGIHAFAGRDVSGLASLAVLRPRELQLRSRLAVRQEVGLHQEPPVLAPGAQTSSLQSDENPACVVSAGWSAALLQRPAPRHAAHLPRLLGWFPSRLRSHTCYYTTLRCFPWMFHKLMK